MTFTRLLVSLTQSRLFESMRWNVSPALMWKIHASKDLVKMFQTLDTNGDGDSRAPFEITGDTF